MGSEMCIRDSSATAQFFINSVYNKFLDHVAKTSRGWGYTAFGRVIDGMEVVDQLEPGDIIRRVRVWDGTTPPQ